MRVLMGRPEPQDVIATLTELLQKERRRSGLSHETLAELSGVHRSTVSRIESGTVQATLLVFLSLAKALGISLGELILRAERRAQRARKVTGAMRTVPPQRAN